jgi:hypothetical protein
MQVEISNPRLAGDGTPNEVETGDDAPCATPAPKRMMRGVATVESLLKSPGLLLENLREGRATLSELSALIVVTMVITGLSMATFAGGLQFLVVPIKLCVGVFICALACFPSLHIFSCLSGARQTPGETWGALLMAIALLGVLLVGFAPIAWVFSYASTSPDFMAKVHVVFLLVSGIFAINLLQRVLSSMNGAPVKGLAVWGVLFLLVVLQMSTTLRPLVGSFDGHIFHERLFFLDYWTRD